MRNDVPAALPLCCLIAGLAFGSIQGGAALAIVAFLIVACGRLRIAIAVAFVALGITLAGRLESRRGAENAVFKTLDTDRFVQVEAEIEHDWAPRESSFVLRSSQFRSGGYDFDAPIAIWTAFEPPPIRWEAAIRAEGFLRRNERGEYTMSVKSARLLSYSGRLPRWHPAGWNRALARRLESRVAEYPEEVALAEALLLGRGELLTDEMRESFRRGGTYHLLVFSGLQIAFAASLLAMLLRSLHAPRASDWLLLVFAGLAPPFIGPTPSVTRASVAIGLYALSRLLRRPTSPENLWCFAALLWLVIEPGDVTDPSFHLTYGGAAALLFAGKHIKPVERRAPRPAEWLAHALSAEIVIAPLTLFHFNQYALGGSLLTLLMAPVVFAILVLSLLASASPLAIIFECIALLHQVCLLLNRGGLSGYFASPPLWSMLAAAALAGLALGVLRGRRRALAILGAMLVATLAAAASHVAARAHDSPTIEFLDVGQGDAILLRSERSVMLIDGGRYERITQLLAERGVRTIDVALLTHAHPDHCGGLPAVLESFAVRELWLTPRRLRGECAERILEAAASSLTPIHLVRDGERAMLGEIGIRTHLAGLAFRRARENNASVVIEAAARGRRFLLTGDIEREAEIVIGERLLRADVLKVAHHGSRSSTSTTFLDSVHPRLAIISCGRRNLFGHPDPTVVERLEERRIRVWRTDRDGSVLVRLEGGKLHVSALGPGKDH